MTVVIAFVSVGAFILALWAFRIVPLGARAISISKDAASVMRDDRYNDLEREKAVQQYSIRLFKVFFSIIFRSVLVFAVSILPIWLAGLLGWINVEEVTAFLLRADVILITSILLILVYFAGKALWPSK